MFFTIALQLCVSALSEDITESKIQQIIIQDNKMTLNLVTLTPPSVERYFDNRPWREKEERDYSSYGDFGFPLRSVVGTLALGDRREFVIGSWYKGTIDLYRWDEGLLTSILTRDWAVTVPSQKMIAHLPATDEIQNLRFHGFADKIPSEVFQNQEGVSDIQNEKVSLWTKHSSQTNVWTSDLSRMQSRNGFSTFQREGDVSVFLVKISESLTLGFLEEARASRRYLGQHPLSDLDAYIRKRVALNKAGQFLALLSEGAKLYGSEALACDFEERPMSRVFPLIFTQGGNSTFTFLVNAKPNPTPSLSTEFLRVIKKRVNESGNLSLDVYGGTLLERNAILESSSVVQ